jgi:tetratricopeptide (TPR) repeat protein
MAREIGFKSGIAVLQANLSIIQQDQGEYGAALASLAEAEEEARETQDSLLLTDCLTYLGTAHRLVGDLDGAEKNLEEALGLARELDLPEPLAKVQLARAELFGDQSRTAEAMAALREAADFAGRSGNFRLQLMARLAQGKAAASIANLTKIASQAAESGLVPVASRAHLALATAHLSGGDHARALQAAEETLAAAAPPNERDVIFQARHLAGQAQLEAGEVPAAAEFMTAALEPLEEMLENLPSEARSAFLTRSSTASYLTDAQRVFRDSGRTAENERLQSLRRP